MRKFLLFFFAVILLASTAGSAQVAGPPMSVPQGINYQAVVRDNNGNALANTVVSFRVSILQGSVTGPSQYTETHRATTNAQGLVNFVIFRGTYVSGSDLTWFQLGPYFVKVEMDRTGGSSYQLMGTSELLSVPYAINARASLFAYQAGPYYKVGDKAEGGLVIATWDGGRHGWVVALEDESKKTSWENATLLVQADTTGGYRDWVLPNMAQLKLIYEQREEIKGLTAGAYLSNNIESDYEGGFHEEVLFLYFNHPRKAGEEEDARKNEDHDGQEIPTPLGARAVRQF